MTLVFSAEISVKKDVEKPKDETYTDDEVLEYRSAIEAHLRQFEFPDAFTTSTANLIKPLKIKIPLADLRMEVVDLMKAGTTEIELEEFLFLLKGIYNKQDT